MHPGCSWRQYRTSVRVIECGAHSAMQAGGFCVAFSRPIDRQRCFIFRTVALESCAAFRAYLGPRPDRNETESDDDRS